MFIFVGHQLCSPVWPPQGHVHGLREARSRCHCGDLNSLWDAIASSILGAVRGSVRWSRNHPTTNTKIIQLTCVFNVKTSSSQFHSFTFCFWDTVVHVLLCGTDMDSSFYFHLMSLCSIRHGEATHGTSRDIRVSNAPQLLELVIGIGSNGQVDHWKLLRRGRPLPFLDPSWTKEP